MLFMYYYFYISASDIVKRMFTLEFQPRKKKNLVKKEKIVDLVKRHELDQRSPEAQSKLKL